MAFWNTGDRVCRRCDPDNGAAISIVRQQFKKRLTRDVRSVLFDAELARDAHAVLVGSSRLEMLCVADFDNSKPPLAGIEDWEDVRSIELPWIHELTPAECLMVRGEAHTALPKLRALLKARLGPADGNRQAQIQNVVAELRGQVSDVEEEIVSISKLGESRYRVAIEGLGLSLAVYGLASGAPAVAASGLAALIAGLAHAQNGAREVGKRKRELITAPAFALAKAREVLRRRKPELTSDDKRRSRTRRRTSARSTK